MGFNNFTPQEAHDIIREACLNRPDLMFKDKNWKKFKHNNLTKLRKTMEKIVEPFQGYCYVATYAFCHLIPEARPYTIDRKHFWAQIGDEVWDLTKEQFKFEYPYHKGRKLPRKSKPTERVKELLKEIGNI